jgi:putative ABC transport system permease protein
MIGFLLKGLLRDPSRSLFPVITVAAGVMLTVVLHAWITGLEGDLVRASARFSTGHVRVMSRAYAAEEDQLPNDLALLGVDSLLRTLKTRYPELQWTPRIRFGGLLDIPDGHGETRAQGPVAGFGVNLIGTGTSEPATLNLETALVRGRLPARRGEALVSEELASRLGVRAGETATFIGSTRHGSFTTANLIVAGTIRFGITALDRGTILADLEDVREALDMSDGAGEIVGYFPDGLYHEEEAKRVVETFRHSADTTGEFAPMMFTLREQAGLGVTLDLYDTLTSVLLLIFILVMSIVLWNAGLMASLRRYGEFGLRLAMGEAKGGIYRAMLAESVMIGIIGSVIGTGLGLGVATYLQNTGIDIGSMMNNASIMIANTVRARVTPVSYVIGFLPGLAATLLGTSVAGIGIFRRQTAQLTRELQS